ncbi:hypothetical protein ACFXDH_17270 [Streptomyces sp. NPDC059467]|uniref:hypothetical protein n=1 Tax=Streptomyces sp. NPDC059467 TaxID=3346844 RepID=UPI003699D8E2
MLRNSGGQPLDPRLRLLALAGVMVCAVVLPLTVASAGQVGDAAVHPAKQDDQKLRAPARSPRVLGLGLATAARCGPALTSPEGVEAQTCVMTQGADTWARTYYRNATGAALDAVLSLMGPSGRTLQTHCDAGADDEPATCETPREHTRGALDAYTAVAEFAARGGGGPLLLRSGSNSGSNSGAAAGGGSRTSAGSNPGSGSGGSAGNDPEGGPGGAAGSNSTGSSGS